MSLSVHRQLLRIKKGHRAHYKGICNNLYQLRTKKAQSKFINAIKSWPLRRGTSLSYPVEGDMNLYVQATSNDTIWEDPRRLALLDYLIEYYKPKGRSPILLKSTK